jgi:hypothetical protein
MGKRILERLMMILNFVYMILLPYGYIKEHPVVMWSGITCGVISMVIWYELERMYKREKELDRKYGKRTRTDY